MHEGEQRRLVAALAQRKHAESALWALVGLPRMEPVEFFLSVLTDVHHVAHNGVSRQTFDAHAEGAGRARNVLDPSLPPSTRNTWRTISPHFESHPPAYDRRAVVVLNGMLRDVERVANNGLNKLDDIVGEAAA